MSISPTYLITTSTGNTGFHIAQQLLTDGLPVRIMARSKSPRTDFLMGLGAQLTLGNLDSEEDLRNALSGIQRVYYCHPIIPNILKNTALFTEIAAKEKIESVINLGQYLAELDTHPSRSTCEHKRSYQVLNNANIGACHVIPGWFAENFFPTSLFITQLGLFPFPIGDGKCPVVSNEDIASVCVSLLKKPEGHENKRYQPTGPKAIGMEEILAVFAKVLGRKVRQMPMPNFMFSKAIIQFGFHPYLTSQLSLYIKDFQSDRFNYKPNDIVERFTGHKAESFETICRRNFQNANLMKKTISGQWQAIKQFMQIGFSKAPSKKEMTLYNT